MDPKAINSLALIAARFLWPLIGGASVMSENQLVELVGYLVAAGAILYHARQHYLGKKAAQ